MLVLQHRQQQEVLEPHHAAVAALEQLLDRTVGENARIKAEIKTATVVVYGKVHGNLTATDRVELKSSAEVVGDIKAKTLSIEAGAIFVGKSTVRTPANLPASTAPAKGATPEAPKQTDLAGTAS